MQRLLKTFILFSLIISLPSFAITLRTQEEKLSYAIGNQIGASFRQHDIDLNPALVMQGLQDGLAGNKSKLSPAEQQQVMVAYQKQMLAKAQANMQQQGEANQVTGDKFLKENATQDGVQVTASGLQYKILENGRGRKPTANDIVKVDYQGTLINGQIFDSSYRRGKPAVFPVSQVIPGWTEALQMMPVGSTWMLYIPANLAYGQQGMPLAGIGPNSVLVFKVHLISIEKKQ